VIQQARAEGVLRITLLTDLKNDNAQDLYRKLGFVNSSMQAMRLKLAKIFRSVTVRHDLRAVEDAPLDHLAVQLAQVVMRHRA